MIDLDDTRLEMAKRFGATASINSADGKAVETVMKMTGERGVDTAIEAVGIPATFELCEKIVAPGGTIANIGVHGTKVDFHLENLWDRNITKTPSARLITGEGGAGKTRLAAMAAQILRETGWTYPSAVRAPHPGVLRLWLAPMRSPER